MRALSRAPRMPGRMGYGERIDAAVGKLSRLLHLRATHTDTSHELVPYYGLPLAELLPAPGEVPTVRRHVPRLALANVTETLSWPSAHVPLSPAYRRRHEGEYQKNLTAWARWIHKKGARRRSLLVYVHGWLEPGSWVEEATLLPLFQRELGVDVVHVSLPFHGRRSPRGQLFHGEWFWTADLVRSLEAVRQAVFDVRALVSWFRQTIGYEEVGITGISLGGCITMLLGCLAPTPDYIVPMIAHLELPDAVEEAPILWRMKDDLARFGLDEARRRAVFSRIPLASAMPLLPPERQLWVAAREDGYLRAELVEQQWRRWQEPPILWIPGGHMTFPLAVKDILSSMKPLPRLAGAAVSPTGR